MMNCGHESFWGYKKYKMGKMYCAMCEIAKTKGEIVDRQWAASPRTKSVIHHVKALFAPTELKDNLEN